MFNSISGTVTAKAARTVFVETAGLEWALQTSEATAAALPEAGGKARVFTWLYHREDAVSMFGFATEKERALFLDLLKVDGVGAKGALKILSALPAAELEKALDAGDLPRLEAVSGIGKKTAQKMILALKGKLTFSESGRKRGGNPNADPWFDVISGLAAMGYDRVLAEEAVLKTADTLGAQATEETVLRGAIVYLAGRA